MPSEKRVQLAGSERAPLPGAALVGAVQPDDVIRVSVILRHKSGGPKVVNGQHIPHQVFAEQHGADPEAIAAVEEFAHRSGLTIVESSARKRRVILSGTARALSQAFDAPLHCYRLESSKHEFRGRTGTLMIP